MNPEQQFFLKHWLLNNRSHPYASKEIRKWLADNTNLSEIQITNWLLNSRKTKWFKDARDMYSKERTELNNQI